MDREEILEYELVDIDFGISYELPEDISGFVHEDVPAKMNSEVAQATSNSEKAKQIEYDADGIPMGCSREETLIRRKIITEHFRKWREEHKDNPRVYNENLKDYIKINQVFMIESKEHAATNYKSTKAVLNMETIMTKAIKLGDTPAKEGNKNQKPFQQMIIMHYKSDELGDVKMTVGIRFRTKEKVQYSINIPSPGTPFIDETMKSKNTSKANKRKKHSR